MAARKPSKPLPKTAPIDPSIAPLFPDIEEAMLAALEYAMKRPDNWHKIDPAIGSFRQDATKPSLRWLAIEELRKRGAVEVWRETGLYRLIS